MKIRRCAIIALLGIVLSLRLAAAAPDVDAIIAANTASALLDRCENVTYSQIDLIRGAVCWYDFYRDENDAVCVSNVWPGHETYYNADIGVEMKQSGALCTVYGHKGRSLASTEHFVFLAMDEASGLDTATIVDQGDGTFSMTQRIPMSADYAASFAEASWIGAAAGDILETRMLLDAETNHMINATFTIERARDGMRTDIAIGTLREDSGVHLTSAVEAYLRGEWIMVTFVFEDGTARDVRVPKGMPTTLQLDEHYAAFIDRSGAQSYTVPKRGIENNIRLFIRRVS